jgi:hypothetical protein
MQFFKLQDNVLNFIETITVKLQSNEAITVSLLSSNPNSETTSLDLRAKGVKSPIQSIARLKVKGAIITSTRRTITDEFGKVRKGIACYKLVGWK